MTKTELEKVRFINTQVLPLGVLLGDGHTKEDL